VKSRECQPARVTHVWVLLSIEKGGGQRSEIKSTINVDSLFVNHRARDWSEKAKESQPARPKDWYCNGSQFGSWLGFRQLIPELAKCAAWAHVARLGSMLANCSTQL
jgi:hypothetical protein